MEIINTKFIKSSPDYKQCPETGLPEYAFIGRSNVGKSSLINMLTGRKGLAKISGTPGKTQLINHFLINEAWYIVDLPGYGFAKISKSKKAHWEKMIRDYLLNRKNLRNSFLLIDSRHAPMISDLEFISWFGEQGLPFTLIFTKADKLSRPKLNLNLSAYKGVLAEMWEELPFSVVTSSSKLTGREEILALIDQMNGSFNDSGHKTR
jgi:GTP-binding protein